MNDHTLYLSVAYVLFFFCIGWEIVALRLRRRNALRRMHESVEDSK